MLSFVIRFSLSLTLSKLPVILLDWSVNLLLGVTLTSNKVVRLFWIGRSIVLAWMLLVHVVTTSIANLGAQICSSSHAKIWISTILILVVAFLKASFRLLIMLLPLLPNVILRGPFFPLSRFVINFPGILLVHHNLVCESLLLISLLLAINVMAQLLNEPRILGFIDWMILVKLLSVNLLNTPDRHHFEHFYLLVLMIWILTFI